MTPEQPHDTAQQLTEWHVVGDDDSAMMLTRDRGLGGKRDKVLHVKGQDGSALIGSKPKLLTVREAEIPSFLRRKAIHSSIPKDVCQEWIDIFVKIELDRHLEGRGCLD